MKMEKKELHGVVREGYQVLLRADAELLLPTAQKRMLDFYLQLGESCMRWMIEVHGSRLRKAFSELESVRDRSRFHMGRYVFRMCVPWKKPPFVAILCESDLTGELVPPRGGYYRIAHVWDCCEELMLPPGQIPGLLHSRLPRHMLPFKPDGMYPEGEQLVLFRNATASTPWEEVRLTPKKSSKEE